MITFISCALGSYKHYYNSVRKSTTENLFFWYDLMDSIPTTVYSRKL